MAHKECENARNSDTFVDVFLLSVPKHLQRSPKERPTHGRWGDSKNVANLTIMESEATNRGMRSHLLDTFVSVTTYSRFWCVLRLFKSCDFCEWIMDRRTMIITYTLCNNCMRMFTTKHKSKIAKLYSWDQTHKIALLTDMQNISEIRYVTHIKLTKNKKNLLLSVTC